MDLSLAVGLVSLGCTLLFGGLGLYGVIRPRTGMAAACVGALITIFALGGYLLGARKRGALPESEQISSSSPSSGSNSTTSEFRFSSRLPFPEGFDLVSPGMPISEAKAA